MAKRDKVKKKKDKKDKKERKHKKDKKDKKKKRDKSSKRDGEGKSNKPTVPLGVVVCGHPNSVNLYNDKINEIKKADMEGYQIQINADNGMDDEGKVRNSSDNPCLCVYTVNDPQTVKFLQENVMPNLKDNKKMIAGLGLENRSLNDPKLVPPDTAKKLGTQYNCDFVELVSSDPNQLGVGTAVLYKSLDPRKFDEAEKASAGSDDGGKKKKKKKKKDKKNKGEKKKDKEEKKKKKKDKKKRKKSRKKKKNEE
ncbi:hypothetical protein Aperf_G00000103987 [Anoplocephala perfoliata]